ncbi:peroxisome proliferator-activated receptor delta isoform X1 [Sceloporus undulatus]|uniref:peroxisome proliferator-activated receptor delta isoform X1 n=1 Tax=Sceloporus undulatus TaxID=8520 RepID=UPI001C4B20B6|nr:peroxisome proliferator-activated receptor delta isoform X1 [Sceloporus undulatus]XP_042318655.1 peroxisome proliferator-activated receptor delta isoform X1 [Sceloporus undulatus]XP_042318656.1 peroxisome proliferator-activated receptor delta isoform X1 [Sceloporus undulatus]
MLSKMLPLMLFLWNREMFVYAIQNESTIPVKLWACSPKGGGVEAKLLCHMHGLYANRSNPGVFQSLYMFHAASDTVSCHWRDLANCTLKASGEVGQFCYDMQADRFRIPVSCRPLRTQMNSHSARSSSTQDSSCDVALISAALWKPGAPLHLRAVVGTQTARFLGDQLQLSLISPSGKNITHLIANWESQEWELKRTDLVKQGPPDWVVAIEGTHCDQQTSTVRFKFYGHISITEEISEHGMYKLELGSQNKTVLKFNPLIIDLLPLRHMTNPIVGSHVLKMDQPEQLVMQPQTSLKEVQIHFKGLNVSQRVPQCAPFLEISHKGWLEWVKMWAGVHHGERIKRELKDWLGSLGAGVSIIDAANIEVLANKLSYSTKQIGKLTAPLTKSLLHLTEQPQAISKVLPVWEGILENDNILIVSGIQSLQNNVSLALACEQAQAITQNVVMGMVREAKAGKIPMEVRNLIWPELTPGEKTLEAWWRLLNASYDSTQNMLRLFIITVEATRINQVYPVVPLGFQIEKDLVMYSTDSNRWALMKDSDWQTVNVQGCVKRENLGFICDDNSLEEHHECFPPQLINNSHCSFDVIQEKASTVVYTGKGCICVRTPCEFVIINGLVIQPMLPYINRCFCNISVIVGCDFQFRVPVWTVQHMKTYPSLYREISPISLGFGLSTLKNLLSHPSLKQELLKLRDMGENAMLEIQHRNQEIAQIVAKVKSAGDHAWWEVLLGWSPSSNAMLNIALHPIVMILIFQVTLVFVLLLLIGWMKRQTCKLLNLEDQIRMARTRL